MQPRAHRTAWPALRCSLSGCVLRHCRESGRWRDGRCCCRLRHAPLVRPSQAARRAAHERYASLWGKRSSLSLWAWRWLVIGSEHLDEVLPHDLAALPWVRSDARHDPPPNESFLQAPTWLFSRWSGAPASLLSLTAAISMLLRAVAMLVFEERRWQQSARASARRVGMHAWVGFLLAQCLAGLLWSTGMQAAGPLSGCSDLTMLLLPQHRLDDKLCDWCCPRMCVACRQSPHTVMQPAAISLRYTLAEGMAGQWNAEMHGKRPVLAHAIVAAVRGDAKIAALKVYGWWNYEASMLAMGRLFHSAPAESPLRGPGTHGAPPRLQHARAYPTGGKQHLPDLLALRDGLQVYTRTEEAYLNAVSALIQLAESVQRTAVWPPLHCSSPWIQHASANRSSVAADARVAQLGNWAQLTCVPLYPWLAGCQVRFLVHRSAALMLCSQVACCT